MQCMKISREVDIELPWAEHEETVFTQLLPLDVVQMQPLVSTGQISGMQFIWGWEKALSVHHLPFCRVASQEQM